MQLYLIVGIAGGAAMLVVFLSLVQYSPAEYALDVDAIKDNVNVAGTQSRVVLTNIGHSTITNIVVDFGNDKETLPELPPGGKVIVSPKGTIQLDSVTVTADNGIHITKQFRTAPKAPGMIGGMG